MEEKSKLKQNENQSLIEEMVKSGVHYGRAKRWTHPSIRPFLLKSNKNIELFNLKLTANKLNEATRFMKELIANNKTILFIGTTPAAQSKIRELAIALGQPYVVYKWIAGLLTNFSTIQARLVHFRELLKKESEGELARYQPKERSLIEKQLQKLKNLYSGIVNFDKLPDAIFIVNLAYKQHQTALKEAYKMKIPIVAITGSDNNINQVHFFIPANDKAPRSISFLLDNIKEELLSLKKINESENKSEELN
ncbi:MAG: 30S ribosomal protein S2 [Patescibacteria group bacterium]|nr:30S ribosomal protein S2 [Patescibacteria group bacterium]